MKLKLLSPAKINWTLEILNRRPDGFHEIDTLMQTVSLHDELTFERLDAPRCTIKCDAEGVPADESNLVARAWAALRKHVGGNKVSGVQVQLEKYIPHGGGLGGGSSNAASTLLALNQLYELDLPNADLAAIGATIGSDVPFFIYGSVARATGRGERIEPITSQLAPIDLVLTFPGEGSPTAQAYGALTNADFTTGTQTSSAVDASQKGDKSRLADSMVNTFEQAFNRLENAGDSPVSYSNVKQNMRDAGLNHPMISGSGSTCFALADSPEQATAAAEQLRRLYPQTWAVQTLPR